MIRKLGKKQNYSSLTFHVTHFPVKLNIQKHFTHSVVAFEYGLNETLIVIYFFSFIRKKV